MHYSLLESLKCLSRTLCVSMNGLNFLSRQSNIFGASSGEVRLNSNLTYSNYSPTETRWVYLILQNTKYIWKLEKSGKNDSCDDLKRPVLTSNTPSLWFYTDMTEIQSTLTKSYFNIMEMKSEHFFFFIYDIPCHFKNSTFEVAACG